MTSWNKSLRFFTFITPLLTGHRLLCFRIKQLLVVRPPPKNLPADAIAAVR
jgi:hypothetical protein